MRNRLPRHRRLGAETERDLWINPLQDTIRPAEAPATEILALEPALLAPLRLPAKTTHQVGDGLAILPGREVGQLDASRPIPLPGQF